MKIDKLDEVTILFGISDNNPGNCLLNHIIILGKYTIYSCRCKNIKPSVSLLKAKTSETRKFEFLIAKKNKKESIHYKKWKTCYCNSVDEYRVLTVIDAVVYTVVLPKKEFDVEVFLQIRFILLHNHNIN